MFQRIRFGGIAGVLLLSTLSVGAQTVDKPRPAPQPKVARSEVVNFDSWKLACDEFAEPVKKKICNASLQAAKSDNGQVVFTWTIFSAEDGSTRATFVTPTGVSISQGIDLRIGGASVRKIAFSTCEPKFCTAQFPIDASVRKELSTADKAGVVVYGSTGAAMKMDLSIKGIDKVLATFR